MAKKEAKSTSADIQSGRSEATKQAVDQIKQRFGEGSIMKLGEAKRMEVAAVSTQCLSLDIALGVIHQAADIGHLELERHRVQR